MKDHIYLTLCRDAEVVLSKHNACDIKTVDGKFTCREGHGCCGGCKHLGPEGCTTNSLTCKLWLCHTAQREVPEALQELQAIRTVANDFDIPFVCRGSMEDHMRAVTNRPCAAG